MGLASSTPAEEEEDPSSSEEEHDENDFGGWRDDGTPRPRGSSWSGAFGRNDSKDVLAVNKVDTMQIMWQRALQAKTAALDRLRSDLEEKELRLQQMEFERSVSAEADEFAEGAFTSEASENAMASQHLAVESTSLVLRDMRSEMAERETRLDALSLGLQR
jgi:hypothetical protein